MAKYNKQIVQILCNYIREGDSQQLACKKAGIGHSAFYDWLNTKPEFAEAVKKAKDEFQATIKGKLQATLWKRAMGYEVTETETEYVSDANGNPKIKSQKTKVKHIQPDTGALIFALTNVAPEKWINRQRVEAQVTKEIKEQEHDYYFEDLPKNVLFDIADSLQAGEYERIKNGKMLTDGSTQEKDKG